MITKEINMTSRNHKTAEKRFCILSPLRLLAGVAHRRSLRERDQRQRIHLWNRDNAPVGVSKTNETL